MRLVCILAIAAAVAAAVPLPEQPALSEDIVNIVNSANAGWRAGFNARFDTRSISGVKRLLGVRNDGPKVELPKVEWTDVEDLPDNFDSRTQWPGCIGEVLDQAECGSCWAFGAAEVASDRMCIEGASSGNNGSFVQLAPLDLVACDSGFLKPNHGCQGGMPGSAANYIKGTGLVKESCMPYLKSEGGPVPTCTDEPCLDFVSTPKCQKSCADGSEMKRSKYSRVYDAASSADSIAQEIMKNGPVEVTISVAEDFVHYKSGVYKHTTGSFLGGHAIKMIGFGVEDGQKYWLLQNSWTTSWGDGGYIKVLRGVNEIGIEDSAVCGTF